MRAWTNYSLKRPRHATPRFLAYGKAQGGLKRPADAAMSTLDAYLPLRDAFIQGRFDPKLAETIQALGVRRPATGNRVPRRHL